MRFKRISYRRIQVTSAQMGQVLFGATGLMQVPVLYDRAADRWLRDTTSIIKLFEADSSAYSSADSVSARARSATPECGADRFLALLLEEFADEWLWAPALYYRWHIRLDAGNVVRRFIMHDFARELPVPLPRPLAELYLVDRQHDEYVARGAGVRDAAGEREMERIYLATLDALQAVLAQRPFLLGARPSVADFGFFASMFRHFALDPTPAKIMRQRAPAVYEWVARLWNSGALPDEEPESETGNESRAGAGAPRRRGVDWAPLAPLLADAADTYLPYLAQNADAVLAGEPSVPIGPLHMMTVPFRSWTAAQLLREWDALAPTQREQVLQVLGAHGAGKLEAFLAGRAAVERAAKLWQGQSAAAPPLCPPPRGAAPLLNRVVGTANHELRTTLALSPLMRGTLALLAVAAVSSAASPAARRAWLTAALAIIAWEHLRARYL